MLSTNREEAERLISNADYLRSQADEIAWELGDKVTVKELENRANRMEARALILQEDPDGTYPLF